ncbi:flagellar hook-associated protein FlgL [Arthrobacter sp. JSM 101049]|uniref:flagellar hook-associated protein FlgL n=1 Tax=Arthrobacter sp. JSM 101049 TaxID=929097 RepID=UPI00356A6668
MINRITNAGISAAATRNLQTAMQRLATAQTKASSLEAISRPSDNPAGTATSMAVRAEARANEQYSRNVGDAKGWLATADSALSSATTILNRIRELTVRGANDGSINANGKEAIAIELETLRDSLADAANTQYAGRLVFAGTADASAAVTVKPDETTVETDDVTVTFTATGGKVDRRTGPNTTVRVDTDAAEAFGPITEGGDDVFSLITNIIKDLRGGDNISQRIDQVDAAMQNVRDAQTSVGVRHATVLAAESTLMDNAVALEGRRSAVEDIDLGTAILDLKTQEVAYQAALAASARILQPTLMDFLR